MPWSNSWDKPNASGGFKEPIGYIDVTQLRIKDGNKYRNVTAEVVGDLALEYDDDGWCIHHVPTLTKFDNAVPSNGHTAICSWNIIFSCNCEGNYEYDKQPLLNWMQKVQEEYKAHWHTLRLLTPENYASGGENAKQVIMKWCLSVKVE